LTLTGVPVEKLLTRKIAKKNRVRMRYKRFSRVVWTFFYLQISAVFDGKGVFQHPQAITLRTEELSVTESTMRHRNWRSAPESKTSHQAKGYKPAIT
jgi:hypothetical protein